MSYTLDISLALGSSKSGLTLNAQLFDSDLVAVGSAISSGFNEVGNGYYLWHYEDFPDGFRGGVKFYQQGVSGTTLTFVSINPQETENADVKTSSIGSSSSDQINVNVGHSNIVVENTTDTPIGNNTNIQVTTNSESLDPQIIETNGIEVDSTENINIIQGIQPNNSPIKITTGIRQ